MVIHFKNISLQDETGVHDQLSMLKELYEEERQYGLVTKAQLKEVQEARADAEARVQDLERRLTVSGSCPEASVGSPTPRHGTASESVKAETARAVAAAAAADLEALRSERSTLRAAMEIAGLREAELRAAMEAAESREAELRAAVEAERRAREDAERRLGQQDSEDRVEAVADLRQACSELVARAEVAEGDKKRAEARSAELEARVLSLEADLQRVASEAAALEASMGREAELVASSMKALKAELQAEADLAADAAAERVAVSEAAAERAAAEAVDLRVRLAEVHAHLDEERCRCQQAMADLASASSRLQGTQARVVELEGRCQRAEEACLDGARDGAALAGQAAEAFELKVAALARELSEERERGEAALAQRDAFWKQEVGETRIAASTIPFSGPLSRSLRPSLPPSSAHPALFPAVSGGVEVRQPVGFRVPSPPGCRAPPAGAAAHLSGLSRGRQAQGGAVGRARGAESEGPGTAWHTDWSPWGWVPLGGVPSVRGAHTDQILSADCVGGRMPTSQL